MTVYLIVDTNGVISLVPRGQPTPPDGVVIGETSDPDYLVNSIPTEAFITKFAFLQRFTEAELVAVELAKLHNPAASQTQNELAAALRAHQLKLDAAKWVDLLHPETVAGVNSLETVGLLATGRASVILSTSISDNERP